MKARPRFTPDQMMDRMGFATTDTGPYVSELRLLIKDKISQGLVDHSAGTWTTGDIAIEEKAKALLRVHWAIDNGRTYLREVTDPIFVVKYSLRTNSRRLQISWSKIPAWLRDIRRRLVYQLIIARDRITGKKNPYR